MVAMPRFHGLLAAAIAVSVAAANAATVDYPKYVNVFLGTANGGNMFPGVVPAPFRMVKLAPDVENLKTDTYSGCLPEGQIYGFAMLHASTTGAALKYGVVSQMPSLGSVPNPLLDLGLNRTVPNVADLRYYRRKPVGGVTVELAATERAGMYKYTLPTEAGNAVVVDASYVLPSFRGYG